MEKFASYCIAIVNTIFCGIAAYYGWASYQTQLSKESIAKSGVPIMISRWPFIFFGIIGIILLISTWIVIYKMPSATKPQEQAKFIKWPEPYNPISVVGKTFRNEKVVLDGYSYSNCKFYNVTFVYNGTTSIQLSNNEIHGAWLASDNPAVIGSFILMLSFKSIIDQFKLELPTGNVWEPFKNEP